MIKSQLKKKFLKDGYVVIDNFLDTEELGCAIEVIKTIALDDWWLSSAPSDELDEEKRERYHNSNWTKVTGGTLSWELVQREIEKTYAKKRQDPTLYTYAFVRTSNELLIEPFKELMRARFNDITDIVSQPISSFFSCFISSYHRGCYLNPHTDKFKDVKPIPKLAFILNISRNWEPQMGGLLHILNDDNSLVATIVPTFNTLVILKLPRQHFVSEVAQPTTGNRQAFSGWLR